MLLKGSCHCQAVGFWLESHTPSPFMLCYCSICRKQQGGGGYAINLGAKSSTLEVTGKGDIGIYSARIDDDEHPRCDVSSGQRNFCRKCGACLWLYDPTWPDLIHPFASAINGDLPKPPERVHIMLKYKASWVEPAIRKGDRQFDVYPEESIADWHKRTGMWVD